MFKYSPSLRACPQNIREALNLKRHDTGGPDSEQTPFILSTRMRACGMRIRISKGVFSPPVWPRLKVLGVRIDTPSFQNKVVLL